MATIPGGPTQLAGHHPSRHPVPGALGDLVAPRPPFRASRITSAMQASSPHTPPSPRLYSIQALRALAVLMVVAFHLFKVDQKYAGELALLPDWFAAGTGGVGLLFG